MATTLATEKQADAIKQRMAEIRTELPYDVDDARMRVRELTDWKYHMARHPLPLLAVAAGAGYLLVPSKPKQPPEPIIIHQDSRGDATQSRQTTPLPAKRGLVGGIVGAVTSLAVKQLTTVATNQISRLLSKPGTS
ncbi:hypothetical protein Enr13x_01570 [Stieleria neptunia]|uniref:DUF3618 domain-containing protein n=1 Tax=Stieleria neptunia TaxID=2527979 RepID=A0A518HHN1_9BACT|nr:hypothetical protein [Stieleria neptunia]QDV40351.1 hypothetical protein Enr13x_01570 [Stieleria neptunia]